MKALTLLSTTVVFCCSLSAKATIQTKPIIYKQGTAVLEGFISYDDKVQGKRPGVLVLHDWKGVGNYTKTRAEQLAALGYIALAADIYGQGIRPKDNKDAGAQAQIYRKNRPLLRSRAQAGLDILAKHEFTDSSRLAAMGYCFGGGAALELARSGAPVLGTVSFHGNLDTPVTTDAKNIKGKVLVLHGADDPNVPPEQVQAFQAEMRTSAVDWQFMSYGGAVHSFSNPEAGSDSKSGNAYNESADKRSFRAMQDFFTEIFKK